MKGAEHMSLAYSVSSGDARLSLPVISYHYLNAGPVLGNFHQVSISMGAFNRVEFGYTGNLHQDGSTAGAACGVAVSMQFTGK
jgi:hypothetical protein